MSTPRARYAIDFHVHTWYSFDSVTPPRVAIEAARRRGLDGIAITDHDTVEGALAALKANPYSDFLIIPGIEVKSDLGDIIGLYITKNIASRRFGDVIEEIHAQGGIAYLPHPIRTFGAVQVPDIYKSYPAIDLWELYNGRYDRADFAQARNVFEDLAIGGPLCGSDAHFPWEIGLFRNILTDLPSESASLMMLSASAELQACPRGDVALRTGISLASMIKAFKRKQYAKLAELAVSLPWKGLKRIVTVGLERLRN